MSRLSIYPPPPPPAGLDVKALRPWFLKMWQSLHSCSDALRNMREEKQAIAPRDALGGGSTGADLSKFRFGYSISGANFTIKAGAIRPSDGRAAVTATAQTFALGGTKYAYVSWDRQSTTATIYAAATLPQSTINVLNWPLHEFDTSGYVATYHVGDIVLDTPIR